MAAITGERRGLWRSRWAAIGAALAVTFGGGGLIAVNASSPASSLITIDPARILDTRTNVGLPGPFVSASPRTLQVTGPVPGPVGTQSVVPPGATGVLLNVTVVQPSANGFLTVRPGVIGLGVALTSSLNFEAGDITANSVQVGLPTAGAKAGAIDIIFDAYGQPGQTAEVLVDVVGYMIAGGSGSPAKIRWAKVSANANGANVQSGFGVYSASRVATGVFNVQFDGDIESCGWTATLNDVSANQAGPGEIAVERRSDNLSIRDLWVRTYNSAGSPADPSPGDGFTVTVICP